MIFLVFSRFLFYSLKLFLRPPLNKITNHYCKKLQFKNYRFSYKDDLNISSSVMSLLDELQSQINYFDKGDFECNVCFKDQLVTTNYLIDA
jgi:hypothetical protein